jgi:hypothetical protein
MTKSFKVFICLFFICFAFASCANVTTDPADPVEEYPETYKIDWGTSDDQTKPEFFYTDTVNADTQTKLPTGLDFVMIRFEVTYAPFYTISIDFYEKTSDGYMPIEAASKYIDLSSFDNKDYLKNAIYTICVENPNDIYTDTRKFAGIKEKYSIE